MSVKKHETLEAGATLGTAEEITEALKISAPVDQMIALQGLGLEVIPVQGAKTVDEPWTVPDDKKFWEKQPGGRPMTQEEWESLPEADKKYRDDGSPKRWKKYGSRTPLEFYSTEYALDFIEKKYHGAGVIFQDGLIGIDADTPDEVAFLEEWLIEHCSSRTLINQIKTTGIPFTVRTPGKVSLGEDGHPVWKHSEGGHLWIRMPDGWADELPARAKEKTTIKNDSTGFDVKRGGGYFLTAGTTRTEGPYLLVGEVLDATSLPGLVKALKEAFTPAPAPERKPFTPVNQDTAERLQEWSYNRSWSSIMSDLGWTFETVSCGHDCVEFIYPGSSSGQNSGIAHSEDCGSCPVPGAIHFWSSTAITGLNLGDNHTLKKYRFVLDHIYGGNKDTFFMTEPVKDTRDDFTPRKPQEAPRAPKNTNGNNNPKESPAGLVEAQEGSETPITGERSGEKLFPTDTTKPIGEQAEELERRAKKKSFESLLDKTRTRMEVRQSVSGFSYLPIIDSGVVGIDQGEDWAIDEVRNLGDGVPSTETYAKSILSRMKRNARRAVSSGERDRADETPRFWSEAASNDITCPTFIYRGAGDWEGTGIAPFYKISSDGCEESTGGEADAVFLEREDFEPLEADLEATVSDLEGLWTYMNVPVQSRAMILGALITAWVSPEATRPILFASGSSGTGKTRTTERLAALIDPKTGGETSVSTTGNGEPIHQAGLGNETVVIGNISRISRQSSDALAQLGGSSTKVERTLYKNGRNSSYIIRSTAILSTKETGMVLQDDLLNRVIPILPGALSSAQKKLGEREREWKESLPRFRGALMKLVAEVKRDALENPDREFSRSYRWQTVGEVIERVEVVLSRHGMEVKQPWAEVLKSELHTLKGDSLPPIIEWIRDELDKKLSGGPTEVFKKLVQEAGGKGSPATSGWVESARGFNTVLKEYADILEGEGVTVTIEDRYPGTSNRAKLLTIIPREENRGGYDYRDDVEEVF